MKPQHPQHLLSSLSVGRAIDDAQIMAMSCWRHLAEAARAEHLDHLVVARQPLARHVAPECQPGAAARTAAFQRPLSHMEENCEVRPAELFADADQRIASGGSGFRVGFAQPGKHARIARLCAAARMCHEFGNMKVPGMI